MENIMDDGKTIHLFILTECNRTCKYCCNRQYPPETIPVVTVEELRYADTVCLTGGDPFLCPNICGFARHIKEQFPNIENVYVYTSGQYLLIRLAMGEPIYGIDGVNISPKNKDDIDALWMLLGFDINSSKIVNTIRRMKSNRLIVFPETVRMIETMYADKEDFITTIKSDGFDFIKVEHRVWQEEFKPNGGIFRRLPILME